MSRRAIYRFNDHSVLKYMRVRSGLTMQGVATILGTTVTNINRYEHKGVTKIKQLKILSVLYGVPMDVLARNDDISNAAKYLKTPTVRVNNTTERFKRSDIKKRDNGDSGENIAIKLEQTKLAGTPYENGVNGNYRDDMECGFDILSFTREGEQLYIKVKTGEDDLNSAFYLTDNEIEFLRYCCNEHKNYELHRIFNYVDKDHFEIRKYTAEDVIRHGIFKANVYKVKMEV